MSMVLDERGKVINYLVTNASGSWTLTHQPTQIVMELGEAKPTDQLLRQKMDELRALVKQREAT